eukprot:CAMPEP_0181217922 /NCGR_PEP_ID=MMETSP1096-20121128/27411_1 /TAXON_ID=156174 ORGANISM="Chrysochromulina ericina, Strain CCMP281" /NCGR_SAMPLE_ID=MMETSP1096 /ASSEMBLY_ACC=CAM_ASM_000453 /LENGTH=142 /DNA_ID=CAMNT_0023310089 /DNA_START=15 /DNA_END=443 /DNA_ORIENTATION=+
MALTFGGWPLGWSTGLAGNWGEPEQFVQAGSSTTLLASSDPQRNLADVASWSEHMPVLHSHGHRGETTRFGQLVTMLVDTSATVQASSWWVGIPNYAQAFLMVLAVVLLFLMCWGCAYCLCIAASERQAKKRIIRRAKLAHR